MIQKSGKIKYYVAIQNVLLGVGIHRLETLHQRIPIGEIWREGHDFADAADQPHRVVSVAEITEEMIDVCGHERYPRLIDPGQLNTGRHL